MDPETNGKQAEVFRAMAQDLWPVPGERQRLKERLMFHESSLELYFWLSFTSSKMNSILLPSCFGKAGMLSVTTLQLKTWISCAAWSLHIPNCFELRFPQQNKVVTPVRSHLSSSLRFSCLCVSEVCGDLSWWVENMPSSSIEQVLAKKTQTGHCGRFW